MIKVHHFYIDYIIILSYYYIIIIYKDPEHYIRIIEKYDLFLSKILKLDFQSPKPDIWAQLDLLLQELQRNNPQYHLNGTRNIWILKPALLSRGRGIHCFNSLPKILDFILQRKIPYVCQKYMENPLVIKKKKFDIRQWVLVTDWNPLTVWFYDLCYVRFGADEYDPNDLNNKYIIINLLLLKVILLIFLIRFSHLTNNSIAKYSEKFDSSEIKGNMWSMTDFASFLHNLTNKDTFYDRIQPRMKKIVIQVLKSIEDMVLYRKKSMELYGFDFMIDDMLDPWIIEINSSPAMDYSTEITERLVKLVMEDVIKVIIDYPSAKNRKNADTGNFTCIHQGNKTNNN